MNSALKRTLLPVFLLFAGWSGTCKQQTPQPQPFAVTEVVHTTPPDSLEKPAGVLADSTVSKYIDALYKRIHFKKGHAMSPKVFNAAMRGYLGMKEEGLLSARKSIISICDFNMPSTQQRLWVIDVNKGSVLYNTYVAHGQGSGDLYARKFSNTTDSHQSSLGFYVTGDTCLSGHGYSLELDGVDGAFNNAARDRKIIVHGAPYVSRQFIVNNDMGYLGRSWGCPAVPANMSKEIINTIKDSTCLFIGFNSDAYSNKTVWLKKPITVLPALPPETAPAVIKAKKHSAAGSKKPHRRHKH